MDSIALLMLGLICNFSIVSQLTFIYASGSRKILYTRKFGSFDVFREHIKCAVLTYDTKRQRLALNFMTPEEFESVILNEDFRKKSI